ncbi:hypothetical protein J6590_082228 [Homalodisca vitripennis]|nr:hypothetical protein J6590_082228 [Homalodisca vitripennis]
MKHEKVVAAHRIPSYNKRRTAPIIVKFATYEERDVWISNFKAVRPLTAKGGHVVDSQETIANLFNEYFVSAPLQLVRASPDPDPATLARCYHQQRSVFLTPVTQA